jgi:uncharacterized membrane protein YebE (DUF533 family)
MFQRVTIIATLCLVAGTALAGTPVLNARQHNERARIAQGVRSGELTRAETARLVHGQRQLRRMENRARADGEVTAAERARLQRAASVQSRRIFVQKHDAQHRH